MLNTHSIVKCHNFDAFEVEIEGVARKDNQSNCKQGMQTDEAEQCVNSQSETRHAWLQSLSASLLPVIYLSEL